MNTVRFYIFLTRVKNYESAKASKYLKKLSEIEEAFGTLDISKGELSQWLNERGITHPPVRAQYLKAFEAYEDYKRFMVAKRGHVGVLNLSAVTAASVAKYLRAQGYDVRVQRVRNMIKWYCVERGIKKEDVMVRTGKCSHVYDLPEDFIDWVKKRLEEDKKRVLKPPEVL